MKFRHIKTGVIAETLQDSTESLYRQSDVFEVFEEAEELDKDDYTKKELKAKLDALNVDYHERDTKQQLLDKLGEA